MNPVAGQVAVRGVLDLIPGGARVDLLDNVLELAIGGTVSGRMRLVGVWLALWPDIHQAFKDIALRWPGADVGAAWLPLSVLREYQDPVNRLGLDCDRGKTMVTPPERRTYPADKGEARAEIAEVCVGAAAELVRRGVPSKGMDPRHDDLVGMVPAGTC